MASYKIAATHTGVEKFKEGATVTDAQLKDEGVDVEFWKGAGILAPIDVPEGYELTPKDPPGAHQDRLTAAGLPADHQGDLAGVVNGNLEAAARASLAETQEATAAREKAAEKSSGKTARPESDTGK